MLLLTVLTFAVSTHGVEINAAVPMGARPPVPIYSTLADTQRRQTMNGPWPERNFHVIFPLNGNGRSGAVHTMGGPGGVNPRGPWPERNFSGIRPGNGSGRGGASRPMGGPSGINP